RAKTELSKVTPEERVTEEKAPESIEELDPKSLVDDHSDDEEAPLSLRDAIVEDDEPEEQTHEMLSVKDLVVVATIGPKGDSTPPPPVKGALKPLPPTPSKRGDTAPPPTITVEAKAEAKTEADTKVERRPGHGTEAKPDPKTSAKPSEPKKADARS